MQFSHLRLSGGDSTFVTSRPLADSGPRVFNSPLDSVLALSQVTAGCTSVCSSPQFPPAGLRLSSRSQFRMLKRHFQRKWLRVRKQGYKLQRKTHRSSHQPDSQAWVHVYSILLGRRSCHSSQPENGGHHRHVSHPPVQSEKTRKPRLLNHLVQSWWGRSVSVPALSQRRILVFLADRS